MSEEPMCPEGTTKFLGPFQIVDELNEGLTNKAEDEEMKNTNNSLSHEEKGVSGENTTLEKESEVKEAPKSETEDNFIQQSSQEVNATGEKQSPGETISCEDKNEEEDKGEESASVEKELDTEKAPESESESHDLTRQSHQEESKCKKQSPEDTVTCEDKTAMEDKSEESLSVEKELDTEKAPQSENESHDLTQQNHQEEKVTSCKNQCEKQSPEETISCEDKTAMEDKGKDSTLIEKDSDTEKASKSETECNSFQEEKTTCKNECEKLSPEETISCEDQTDKGDGSTLIETEKAPKSENEYEKQSINCEHKTEKNDNMSEEKESEVKVAQKIETEPNLIQENLIEEETTCKEQSPEEENNVIVIDSKTEDTDPKEDEKSEENNEIVIDLLSEDPKENEKSVISCHTEEEKEDSISVSHEDDLTIIDLHEESDVAISENVDEEDQEDSMNCHPYSFVIENFELTKEQKIQTKIGPPKSLRETPLRMVCSRIGLLKLLPALNSAKEIALRPQIDNNHFESSIQLLAISTRDTDYIIDVGKLNKELLLLTEIFINPKIVKIIYCSERILTTLQNTLHLYMVNIFDCERAGRVLETGIKSIDMILRKEYSYKLPSGMRQVDCRTRPLSPAFQDYCRAFSHYLIYIYHDYKNKLLSKDEKLYKELMNEFRETSKIIYPPIRKTQLVSMKEELQNHHKCQLEVLEKLNEWRNDTAIKLNTPPAAVISNAQLITLSSTLPMTEFSVCCISKSPSVKEHVQKILVIIREARRKYHLEESPIGCKKNAKNLQQLKYDLKRELDMCTSDLETYKNKTNKHNIQKVAKVCRNQSPRIWNRNRPNNTSLPKSRQNTVKDNNSYSPGFNYFNQAAPVHYGFQQGGNNWNDSSSTSGSYNELKIQKRMNALKRKMSSIHGQTNARKKRK